METRGRHQRQALKEDGRMNGKKHTYFKDIRRMFLLYAIIPVVLITLVCLVIFWGSWKYHLESTNRQENQTIADDFEQAVDAYMELGEELAEKMEVLDRDLDSSLRVGIFQQIYDISNRLGRKAVLYVFDEDMVPVLAGTTTVPEFLNGDYYANWGVYRIMNGNPRETALKLVEDPNSDSMKLVIGKAILVAGEVKGYVIFVMDGRQFLIETSSYETQTVVTDDYGWVYLTNNYDFLDTMSRFELAGQKLDGNIEAKSRMYFITSRQLIGNRLHVYSISGFGNQLAFFRYIAIILSGIFTMLVITVFLSTKHMASKKTKDIYSIVHALEKVKEGNLKTYIETTGNDEFRVIGESYNLMLDSLEAQIDRNVELGRLVADAQSKQLLSQFNPHFLFNTLENIRFMTKLDPDSASRMIISLSTLLRYSISSVEDVVTLKEDIDYTENYMSILKSRFNQRFSYTIDISPEAERCISPKLLIQPMIENSVKYGYKEQTRLNVNIKGTIEEGNLVLVCTDDGAGMEERTLEEIREILSQHTNNSPHSGLFNIHRRIQLKYGSAYGVRIDSEEGRGTRLKVVLPVITR